MDMVRGIWTGLRNREEVFSGGALSLSYELRALRCFRALPAGYAGLNDGDAADGCLMGRKEAEIRTDALEDMGGFANGGEQLSAEAQQQRIHTPRVLPL